MNTEPEQVPGVTKSRRWAIAIVALAAGGVFFGRDAVRAAIEEVAQFISLRGKPEPVSANVLSEHETEKLADTAPQNQVELLLERSINHFEGANDQIAARVGAWRGHIEMNPRLTSLFMTALNSNDLRVRAAAIEVNLAARNREINSASVDDLEPVARSGDQGAKVSAMWDIALLGNRGVEPQRAARILLDSIHDDNVDVRYWAVEGLAHLGTDDTIEPLLQTLHDDPSLLIRERAACSLAQSGMLNEHQRRSAVPRLLDYTADTSLDSKTREWVFQALRDITGKTLPHDPAAWREWYDSRDPQWSPLTRDHS
ncbi:MAG: HEAT repeat domain-containing protein [Vicinamibacteria bacterium]